MSEKVFNNAFEYKVIYVFTLEDDAHRGLLKIGDATLHTEVVIDHLTPNCHELNQAALNRIKAYTNTVGLTPKLLWSEVATRTVKQKDGSVKLQAFRDHQVHTVLKNSGIMPKKLGKSREWFEVDIDTAKAAIDAVKQNHANLSNSNVIKQAPIIFRPEQADCIEKVQKHFKKADRFLINAKMRYGKTFVSLEIIKKCAFKKTIIVTHRPVVDAGWYEDFTKIFNGTDYFYGSKASGYTVDQLLKKNKPFIYFASVQDLRGSALVGGKFDKNDTVFKTVWDCVVVDEAHEGTTTALGEDTVNAIFKEGKGTKFLALSGTPFNILQDYDEDSIYTWDYIMEQECKSEWDKLHFGDSNPYDELPEMRIYTYSLGDVLHNSNYITFEDKAFNFKEFFRTFTGNFSVDYADMPQGAEIGDFVHEADVWSFLNLMTKEDKDSYYPYSNEEYRGLFKHSLWMVPGVKEARALKKLMLKHPIFGCGQFNIVNVAGNGDEEEASEEALSKVRKAIKDAGDDYTITLSCGKLTTGVTVKEWTAVFMLAGSYSTSAANYLQTIFRVQSPCNENGKIKETAYVFDFAPDRTLKMVSEAVSVSHKAGKTDDSDRKILGKFLNYCPVISIAGSQMKEYKTDKLLQQLKKAYADKVVKNGFDDANLYNDELLKLQDIDLENFEHLKKIIGKTKAAEKTKDIDVNNQGLTDEEYEEQERRKKKSKKELSEEEKARLEELKKKKANRDNAISILRGISIRMPLLIYGADIPYDEEITLDKFVEQVDDSSWKEFMPTGVTKEEFAKFRKYYDEDVFIAAGRRIRNIAREADTLNPTDRVKKIAGLFAYFKNPDKETVLTPWRVVNMHMSDCLGGYDFYDEEHRETLDEPRFVDKGQVTTDTFANPKAQILEINSKTGLYPLYVAYSLYRARRKEYAVDYEITLGTERDIWKATVEQNVFIICKTPMAKQITKRTLVGFDNIKINAHYFDDLVNQMKNKPQQFVDRVLKESYWKKEGGGRMKFDAVVGNPPYQEATKDTSDKPVYHLFMETAFKLSDKVTFITPARYLFNAGKTPKDWNEKVLNDEHFKVIYYTANSTDVFPNVDIKGGVAITFRDAKQQFGKIGIYSAFPELNSILSKVISNPSFNTIRESIYLQNKFDLNSLYKDFPDLKYKIGSKGKEKRLTTSIFLLTEVFHNIKESDDDLEILGLVNNNRVSMYINKKYIENHDNLMLYKVIVPKSNGSGAIGEVLSTPVIGQPDYGHTQSFISIGAFQSKDEATAALKYIKSKFARCMLGTLKVTQDNNPLTWSNVPLQDFTSKSDIDWSKSVRAIDRQLYAKYGLSDEEIDFIEDKIKPME
jgi:hypothetical protein